MSFSLSGGLSAASAASAGSSASSAPSHFSVSFSVSLIHRREFWEIVFAFF